MFDIIKKLPLILTLSFIFSLIAGTVQRNESDFVLTLQQQSNKSSVAKLYYDVGDGFSESNISVCPTPHTNYGSDAFSLEFHIPFNFKNLRYDPLECAGSVLLSQLKIRNRIGEVLIDVPIQSLKPISGIDGFQIINNHAEFQTFGSDPQLKIDVANPSPSKSRFLIFVLYLFLFFLLNTFFIIVWKYINKKIRIKTDEPLLPIIVFNFIVLIFLSNPFLRICYDPLEHLNRIHSATLGNPYFQFWPKDAQVFPFSKNRGIVWSVIWSKIFMFLHISDFTTWAKIIHIVQFLLSFGCVTYFSFVCLSFTFPKFRRTNLLSLCCFILWLIGNGCFSVQYQQAWMNWYSVTYQGMAFPLTWLAMAFTVKFFKDFDPARKRQFPRLILLVLFILIVVTLIHPPEIVYFLIFIIFLCFFHPITTIRILVNYWIYCLLSFLLGTFVGFACFYFRFVPLPSIFNSGLSFTELFHKSVFSGRWMCAWRYPASHSELLFISIGAGILILSRLSITFLTSSFSFHARRIMAATRAVNRRINVKFLFFLVFISTLFAIIPVCWFMVGFFRIFTAQIWRFVFASPWFVLLPAFFYWLFSSIFKDQVELSRIASLATLLVIIITLPISTYFCHRAVSGNLSSILKSFDSTSCSLNYRDETITNLDQYLQPNLNSSKTPLFLLRGDLVFPAKMRLNKYFFADRFKIPSIETFNELKAKHKSLSEDYDLIDVELPHDFPLDDDIMTFFPGLSKNTPNDGLIVNDNGGVVGEIIPGNEIRQSFKGTGPSTKLSLLMANYADRDNHQQILINIKDSNTNSNILEFSFSTSYIKDNDWLILSFPNYNFKPSVDYTLEIRSPKSKAGDAVTLYRSSGDAYADGVLRVGDAIMPFDICFKIEPH